MDERTSAGVAHLQAAAHELIRAARAFLDVAEELVEDPGTLSSVLDGVIGAGRARASGATAGDRPGPGDDGRVERITVE